MEPIRWLREDVDERLEGLFGDDPELLRKTIQDILERSDVEPEIEELLLDTLEQGLEESNDETMGLTWICVLLGELGSHDAVGPLLQALVSNDEDFVGGATRALRRIGERAFEAALELIDDEDVSADCYVACVEVLEGVSLHEIPELRHRIEDTLLNHVRVITHRHSHEGDPDGGGGSGVRHLEAASLALARLGAQRARADVETALETVCDGSNAFLLEAVEIFEEQPEGIPCKSDSSWDTEYRWALGSDLPAGEIELPDAGGTAGEPDAGSEVRF